MRLGFDQEMLDTAQGLPAAGCVHRDRQRRGATVSAVAIGNDITPPVQVSLDLTRSGATLSAGSTVAVSYQKPASSADPALQDLENLETPSFGPVSVPFSFS